MVRNWSKKALALMMAMIMVFAMSTAAFAANTVTANVTIDMTKYDSELGVIYEAPITLDREGFTTLFTIAPGAVHQYADQVTVLDAIVQLNKDAELESGLQIGWDTYNKPHGAYAYVLVGQETIEDTANSWYDPATGHGHWEGDSWTLYVNGIKTKLYASNILLSADDDIVMSFERNIEDF